MQVTAPSLVLILPAISIFLTQAVATNGFPFEIKRQIESNPKEGDTICFCEVKYRRDNGCGSALEAVGYRKQKKIISVARYYLMTHGLNEWTPCRFDVIAVDDEEVTVLKNAFEGSQ